MTLEPKKPEPIKQILAFNIYKEIYSKYKTRTDLLIRHYRNDNQWKNLSARSMIFSYDGDRHLEPAIVISDKNKYKKKIHAVILRIVISDINISIRDKYDVDHEYDIADPNDFDFNKFTAFIDSLINCAKQVTTTGVRIQGLDKLIC